MFIAKIHKTWNAPSLLSWKVFNESLNLSRTHAILPERKNIPLPLGLTTTRQRMIKAQGTSVSKWSRSKARSLFGSLASSPSLSRRHSRGGARHPPRWVKCTQIRKHESRFYRRPEVPLKYPHRANERVMAGAKERASRLGTTISSLTLILGISLWLGSPVTQDIANYSKCL